jgi:small subunit ribosomal protein S17e
VDRIKRLSYEVLDKHQSKFGEDFADNKKILDQISIIRSKGLKNEIAGYITKYVKKQIRDEKAKQAQRESTQTETVTPMEQPVQEDDFVADDPQEIVESTEATQKTEAVEPENTE